MKTITLLITILFMTLPLSAIDKGSWEIYTSYNDNVIVGVIHDSDDNKESPRLAKAIEDIIPSWDDVAGNIEETDEFSEHGFSDEADYLRYRYG